MSGTIRLDKPWLTLDGGHVRRLGGQLGVYEIATVADDAVLRIGYAGGRSLFGLRGELERELRERGDGVARFRVEVTMAYLTRYRELLMLHIADHGTLPPENRDDPARLGRLSPS
jgi:hypothetical protein